MAHSFRHASFLLSAADATGFPPDAGAEVAFAGRSNAGKSSALNALTGQRGLARTSKTPGRTQLINFFTVNTDRRLVDLPGYGYAAAPRTRQRDWAALVNRYLTGRDSLRGLVLILDARRGAMESDRQLLAWCRHHDLAVHAVLTKVDKLGRGAAHKALDGLPRALGDLAPATMQLFSTQTGYGVDVLARQLDAWLAPDSGPAATG